MKVRHRRYLLSIGLFVTGAIILLVPYLTGGMWTQDERLLVLVAEFALWIASVWFLFFAAIEAVDERRRGSMASGNDAFLVVCGATGILYIIIPFAIYVLGTMSYSPF